MWSWPREQVDEKQVIECAPHPQPPPPLAPTELILLALEEDSMHLTHPRMERDLEKSCLPPSE